MRRRQITPLVLILVSALTALTAVLVSGTSPALGLDLQGGVSVVLQPVTDVDDDVLDQTIEVIRNRVDALGVAEPDIARQGSSVIVQLPGVENQQRALELVGETAELRFRPVIDSIPGTAQDLLDLAPSTTVAPPADGSSTTVAPEATTTVAPVEGQSATGAATPFQEDPAATTVAPTTTVAPATTSSTAPAVVTGFELTPREDDVADQPVVLPQVDEDGQVISTYQLGPTLATGQIVQTASAEINPSGQWTVPITIKGGEAIDSFNRIAALCNGGGPECPSTQLAIVLDSEVVSAPTISRSSYERDGIVIEGSFTQGEAKDLALVLRYGSLPVNLEPQTVQTVSATLGEDSLRAGLAAGLLGLALVCLYMLFYYRALGLVVVMGLAVWGALNYAIIAWLGETQGLALSLAGVTGIVVSVGVTVDSYVVYFERLKDELRAGRTLRTTTERSFQRAFRTILAGNVASLIGAVLLYWLTVGPVRGFAFFLGLATVLDVVVAWFFTRPVVALLSRSRLFTGTHWFGLARGLTGEASSAQVRIAPTGGTR